MSFYGALGRRLLAFLSLAYLVFPQLSEFFRSQNPWHPFTGLQDLQMKLRDTKVEGHGLDLTEGEDGTSGILQTWTHMIWFQ